MKKRKDCCFGLHFDFHAQPNQKGIGADFKPDIIEKMLEIVKPDFVQCDTKGHPGYTSYPSKFGNSAPEIKLDILSAWRKITAKYDTPLFSHYSGVLDKRAVTEHSDWGLVDKFGKNNGEISVFSPYVDELLIPQLEELSKDYGINGAWIDGECWAMSPDFSSYALNEFAKISANNPMENGEPSEEYKTFCRNGFLKYVYHYVTKIHEISPDFEITSNWLYTSFCPEFFDIPIDFISADYESSNSFNIVRYEARCICAYDKPWDMMAWGFNIQNGFFVNKSALQLEQEMSVPISLGGGVQIYNAQKNGNIQESIIPTLHKLANFAFSRAELCHNAKTIPQVGVLFSREGFYTQKKFLFTKYEDKQSLDIIGDTLALLDANFSVNVIMPPLYDKIGQFPVIVIPNWITIEDKIKRYILDDYVANGGKVVLLGTNAVKNFGINEPIEDGVIYIENGGELTGIMTKYMKLPANNDFNFYLQNDIVGEKFCASQTKPIGAGCIYYVPFDFGEQYLANKSYILTDFINNIISSAYQPIAKPCEKVNADFALTTKDNNVLIHIINRNGEHSDVNVRAFDYIPKIGNFKIKYICDILPKAIYEYPSKAKIDYEIGNGCIYINVGEVGVYKIILVEKF